jgi:hypothetical protein
MTTNPTRLVLLTISILIFSSFIAFQTAEKAQFESQTDGLNDIAAGLTPQQQNSLKESAAPIRVEGRTGEEAVEWQWAKQGGAGGNDYGYSVGTDSSGNAYVTGIFYGSSVSFGNITLTSLSWADIFVAKLDPNGNWLWVVRAGGEGGSNNQGTAIAVDTMGNSYITGRFIDQNWDSDNGEWGPGDGADFGNTTLSSSGSGEIFVAKLDTNGNWLWAERAGGSSDDAGYDITVDSAGDAYVIGNFVESADFGNTSLTGLNLDIFVAKIDSNGNWLWAESAGGTNSDYGEGITVDMSSNIYITGSFYGTANFGDDSLTSSGWEDIFVAKLDSNGNWQWAKRAGAGSASDDRGKDLDVDSSGDILVTGFFDDVATADFGAATLNSAGEKDVFVAKIDSGGEWKWVQSGGGTDYDYGNSITVDSFDNAWVTGSFQGESAEFGNTTLNSVGEDDIFVAKIDSNGNWLLAIRAGSDEKDEGLGITLDSSGNPRVVGYFEGSSSGSNFNCDNGDSIPFDWANDDEEDCDDGSDEPQDYDNDGDIDNVFNCVNGSNVTMDLVNDGTDDCQLGEDEGNVVSYPCDFGMNMLSSSGNSDVFVVSLSSSSDSDGDGVIDSEDAFPNDPNEYADSDGDGLGDNADAFPDDANETTDSDSDSIGDNTDEFPNDANESVDSDHDGVGDNADAFPNDMNETMDSDGDGVGDNADAFPNDMDETMDSDGDGVGDNADAFPNDANETMDTDADGVGDNADAFPNDANETMDTDADGVGDNSDAFPNDANQTTSDNGTDDGNTTTGTNATNGTGGDGAGDGVGDGGATGNGTNGTTNPGGDGVVVRPGEPEPDFEGEGIPGFTFAFAISALSIAALFRRSRFE